MSIDLIEEKLFQISEEDLKKQFRDFNQKIAEEAEESENYDEWRKQIWE